jgi:hypothetical protein
MEIRDAVRWRLNFISANVLQIAEGGALYH